MHGIRLLHKVMKKADVVGHKKRLKVLVEHVHALLVSRELMLTELGKRLGRKAYQKHRIKCTDRLLNNVHLAGERLGLYRWMASWLLSGVAHPVLVVDWSDSGDRRVRILRVGVAMKGRSATLYEETHPESGYNSPKVHKRFLARVATLLPEGCQPLVVTDAGYRGQWFKAVSKRGWLWLGRVRGGVNYQCAGESRWHDVRTLYAQAGGRAKCIGRVQLAKSRPYEAMMYLSARPRAKRHGARRCAEHYRAARAHREPLVLVMSQPVLSSAQEAMVHYALRMQIEESFRDLKSPRYGDALRHSATLIPKRMNILLLIAALAHFVRWLYGLVAHQCGWRRHFQANTETRYDVQSFISLGQNLLRDTRLQATLSQLQDAMRHLSQLVKQHQFTTRCS